MKLTLLYFAWVRERIGRGQEEWETRATTVQGLIDELHARGDHYALAFADTSALRAAVDQELVEFDAPLSNAREVAFFPPMTGG